MCVKEGSPLRCIPTKSSIPTKFRRAVRTHFFKLCGSLGDLIGCCCSVTQTAAIKKLSRSQLQFAPILDEKNARGLIEWETLLFFSPGFPIWCDPSLTAHKKAKCCWQECVLVRSPVSGLMCCSPCCSRRSHYHIITSAFLFP